MFLLMIYTSLIMPFKISFIDDNITSWMIVDTMVDFLFITDIIINLNLPYFDQNNNLIAKRSVIFMSYLKSWLIIDITSSIPMDLLESVVLRNSIENSNLLKLTRLPRIYRLLRIARLLKVFRLVRKMTFINKLKEHLNLTLGAHRMI